MPPSPPLPPPPGAPPPLPPPGAPPPRTPLPPSAPTPCGADRTPLVPGRPTTAVDGGVADPGVVDCSSLLLALPALAAGHCRAATEVSLQWIPLLRDGGEWVDHVEHIRHAGTLRVGGLQPGARYQFRLVAHNEYGSSAPGLASEPVALCSGAAAPLTLNNGALRAVDALGGWVRDDGGGKPTKGSAFATAAVVSAAVLLVGCACVCCCCVLLSVRRRGRRRRPRYGKLGDREDAWENGGADSESFARVSIVLGDGSPPKEVEVSLAGVGGARTLRRRLCDTLRDTHGLCAEPGELQVDLEDAFGEMTPMTEATTMREVVGARRLRVRAPAPGSFEV